MAVAAVTGLAAEARLLHRVGLAALATSGDGAAIAQAVARLVAAGADGIASFGIAGGLAPGLAPGALLLPRRVRTASGETFAVDPTWRERVRVRLVALGLAPADGDLFGADAVVTAPAEKSDLFQRLGAVAVDLESHGAASAARDAGRPFLALRAIADPAKFALPQAALVGLDRDGNARALPVLRALLAEPGQLGALIRLAAFTRVALRSLARAAGALREG
jgi:adenosylhomocysteine nucleosidase